MGQRPQEPELNDGIEDLFEPAIGDAMEEALDDAPATSSKSRLAALRRRAEARLEDKRMRDELSFIDLDWEEA